MTLLDELSADQQAMILYRLGETKVRQIEATIEDGGRELPVMAAGDKIRAQPRMSYSRSRFYQACLRAMGPIKARLKKREVAPTPANAWLEVITAMDQGMLTEPTFSHPYVSDTIRAFSGWSAMWAEFNRVQKQTARGRFIMTYKDILQGTVQ
jgi:hypothetical protein